MLEDFNIDELESEIEREIPVRSELTLADRVALARLELQKSEVYSPASFAEIREYLRKNPEFFARKIMGCNNIWEKQVEIINSVRDHKRTAVASCHGSGKALALDTPLPTPSGWTTMGDVSDGDLLIDQNGRSTKVLSVSEIENRESFRITFSDGSEIVASDDHGWNAIDLRHRPRNIVDWRTKWDNACFVKTIDMFNSIEINGQPRWRIPTTFPIQGSRVWNYKFSPYTIGAWLGDGTTVRAEITCHKDDADHFLSKIGGTKTKSSNENCNLIKFSNHAYLDSPVRFLGGKRITDEMLRSSINDRVELLRGLMDTDGFLTASSSVQIDVCDKVLASGIYDLIVSLGFVCFSGTKPAKLYGRIVGTVYTNSFRPNINPFSLPRKADKWSEINSNVGQQSRHTQRTIVKIEPVGVIPVKCVRVDSARNLYLAGRSLIPTHNSFTSGRILVPWWLTSFAYSIVVTTAPTFRQVEKIIWQEIRTGVKNCKFNLGGSMLKTSWMIDDLWYAFGFATKTPDNFQGLHSEHVLIIVDEASGVNEEIFEAIEGVMTSENCRLLAIGNPTESSGKFYEMFRDKTFNKIHISAFDLPNVKQKANVIKGLTTWEWVEDKKKRWGEHSPVYQSRVLGLFPKTSSHQVVPLSWVEKAIERWRVKVDNLKFGEHQNALGSITAAGLDVSDGGADRTILVARKNNFVMTPFDITQEDAHATMAVLGETKNILAGSSAVLIADSIGCGSGLVSKAMEDKIDIVPFNAASKTERTDATGLQKYLNCRAAAWMGFAELLNPESGHDICLPPDDDLIAELTEPKWQSTSGGQIKIEDKEEIRKRLGRSPDKADALIMSFWVLDSMRANSSGTVNSMAGGGTSGRGGRDFQVERDMGYSNDRSTYDAFG